MIHPSYSELMQTVNKEAAGGETGIVNSRYSIVIATAKRARQIVDGSIPLVPIKEKEKALSIAVEELKESQLKILADDDDVSRKS